MAFDARNLALHIRRIVYSSIKLGYQYACDYPVVLGAGILLLFLHKLCPYLFMFLLSSSPVFLLTALLLGALLSYGEPSAPVIREDSLENQQNLSNKFKISTTDCSTEKVDNDAVEAYAEKKFESQAVYTEERTFDGIVHDTNLAEENATYLSTNTVLCAEPSEFVMRNVIVESEEQTKEICEKVELQKFEPTNTERCHNEMHNQSQLGELMSSCWQPVMRQDPCPDSESDYSESSSDASMTDIIPLLDELNPSVNLGANHPSSTFRDNLNCSSDDEGESEEDGDLSSNEVGVQEKKDDGNNSKYVNDAESSDTENDNNLERVMERRKAKNILKFELDKKLMDMQAGDAIQRMEEASRFRIQVPSISTPRPKPFDPSIGPEETVELQQIPDSAPSVLLPWRKPFDIPFDQIVDRERKLQETWTPRSYFPSTQHRKLGSLYVRRSTYRQYPNEVKSEKPELNGKDACNSHSDSDSEQIGNNGKLFGSLESHMREEIKILSAAISDACVLEASYEVDEGCKNTNFNADTYSFCIQESVPSISEKKDSISAGSEQSALSSLSKENNSEQHIVEADSISEVNLLFKCRMEKVLVQSISESGIGQPLTVKLEDELSGTLSADSGMPVTEASSVEELSSQISQPNKEILTFAPSDCTCDNKLVEDRSREALPVENGHSSQLPFEDGHNSDSTLGEPMAMKIEGKPNGLLTEDGELPVLEASSVEEMNSLFKQLEEGTQAQDYPSSTSKVGQDEGETSSGNASS